MLVLYGELLLLMVVPLAVGALLASILLRRLVPQAAARAVRSAPVGPVGPVGPVESVGAVEPVEQGGEA